MDMKYAMRLTGTCGQGVCFANKVECKCTQLLGKQTSHGSWETDRWHSLYAPALNCSMFICLLSFVFLGVHAARPECFQGKRMCENTNLCLHVSMHSNECEC